MGIWKLKDKTVKFHVHFLGFFCGPVLLNGSEYLFYFKLLFSVNGILRRYRSDAVMMNIFIQCALKTCHVFLD